MALNNINIRKYVCDNDIANVRKVVESTQKFFEFEVDVAVELVEEALEKGFEQSGYHFIFAEHENDVIGYACFGPIPCTKSSFDLYWIAVQKEFEGQSIGSILLNEAEKAVKLSGGKRLYIETASKESYDLTRKFYNKNNYIVEAVIKDFYDEGDDKVILSKIL